MPINPTYPGVYIEEIPSSVHTITGVATSITAFIGRTFRGPENKATTITSYANFERLFGGLWASSRLGFAVRDFYLNGGSRAIIVRLFHHSANAPDDTTTLTIGALALTAASPGSWGNALRARVEAVDPTSAQAVAASLNVQTTDLFNLAVYDGNTDTIEQYSNVTVVPGLRQVDKVLAANSTLVSVSILPAAAPALSDAALIADANGNDKDKAKAAKLKLSKDPFRDKSVRDERSAWVTKAVGSDSDLKAPDDFYPDGSRDKKTGLFALQQADLFNILCIPPYDASEDVDLTLLATALGYCVERRAMLIVDPPSGWGSNSMFISTAASRLDALALAGPNARNAALYFPRVREANPLHNNRLEEFVPCGAIAGIFARTDTERGVWKAPAGVDASLQGIAQLSVNVNDEENGILNQLGINCLRSFSTAGRVIWGARTLRGADVLGDEYKYIPVRRTALYIEESLFRGLQWVVFEPNDEPLWAQIRLNVGAFMQNLFRQGAFQGQSPRDAYFVKCDKETTTQNDINLGIVNVVVGFAPLKPAEFVIIKMQQIAGQVLV